MDKKQRLMYHTQEHRDAKLNAPIICCRDDAWLGEAYYFWKDLEDADRWGETSKNRTGKYEIYQAEIDCENILDTVFNEEHYSFWLKQIEKAAKSLMKKTGQKPTLKEVNEYFKERAIWDEVDGILFQDLPSNENFLLIKPIEYRKNNKIRKVSFPYRKRIQLAAYNLTIVRNFAQLKVKSCTF